MDAPFLLKLSLSFAVGGLWVVVATVLADRSGPKIGGCVSGLPSTVALGLFFLAWTQNPTTAVQATTVMPLVAGINSVFLANYVFFVRRGVWLAFLSSLSLWFVLAFVLVKTKFDSYTLSWLGFIGLFLLSFFLMEKVFRIDSVQGKPLRHSPWLIIARALLGGLAVSFAVFLGKVGGPLWGGIFSTFPAMFISTMLITYFAQGALFSAGVMKSSMVGAISVFIYALMVRISYRPLGLWLGTIVAIAVSFGSGWLVYRAVITKLR